MTQTPTEHKIGEEMPDGTLYAGTTKAGKHLFIGVAGTAGKPGSAMTFDEAQQALKNLADHGHHYRLPTREEAIRSTAAVAGQFNNRAEQWANGLWEPTKQHSGHAVCISEQPPKRSPKA